jgi:multidrug resistance efflux pump
MKIISVFKDKKFQQQFLVLTILFIAALTGYYFLKTADRVFIENSIVQAPITSISNDIPGKLMKNLVFEGDVVKKGDSLAMVGTDTLKSYADGMVIKVNRQIGSIVNAQTPIVQTINLNDMKIVGTIDENKGLEKIKLGQAVSFTLDTYPTKEFWGYVDEVAPSAKQTSLAFSISSERPTQQFEVFVKFDAHKYPEIKNGMSAKMYVFTKTN